MLNDSVNVERIKEFFRADILKESSEKVDTENLKMLYLVNLALCMFSGGLYLFAIITDSGPILKTTYGFYFALSLLIFLFLQFVVAKNHKWITAMILLDYLILNCYLLRIGIGYHDNAPATSFYIFMGLAFCFMIKPTHLIFLQTVSGGLFAIVSYLHKPYEASRFDIVNALMMIVMSSVLGCTILRFRMNALQKLDQKDQALKVSELYQSILDEMQTGIVVHDIDTGKIFYGNRKIKEIYGIKGELVNQCEDSPIYRERGRMHLDLDIEALKNGAAIEATEFHSATDRYYQVKGKIIDWYGREAYAEYLTDVTDSERFGEQLQLAHEELQRKYQEAMLYRENAVSSDVIASSLINLTHGYIEEMRIGNEDGFEKQYHYAVDLPSRSAAFTNKVWLEPEQIRNMSPEVLLENFSKGKNHVSEQYVAELKNGKHVWLRTEVTIVERPETAETIAFAYSRDVTREEVLAHILTKIMSFEYDEIYTIDSLNGNISAVAKGQYALNGQLEEGTYAQELEFLRARADSEIESLKIEKKLNLKHICHKLERNQTYVREMPLISKNGKSRLKQLRFLYLNEKVGMILFTLKDIDEVVKEEKEKQERLEVALRMAKEANATKTNFLASMSHEIRTPMNAIIGLTSIIRDDAGNAEVVEDCTKKLDSASKYLLSLLNDILDMSRIESGKVKLQNQQFDANQFWDSVNTLAAAQAKPAGINYIFEKSENSSSAYIGDAIRLQQIMVNLINNAIKFTASGGFVRVSVEEQENVNGKIRMTVKVADNGIGISEEFLPNVFQAFTQEHDGNTSTYGGSGLGLSIAKNYAKLMNGDITVESRVNVGTTFTVVVWLDMVEEARENLKKEQPVSDQQHSLAGKHVLLVEDHPLNTMVAARLLEKQGMKVTHAENGKEAVQMFENGKLWEYDVILMDIRMPIMDGIEATMQIRGLERRDAKRIPIIAMTANAYDEDRKKTREAGMNAHLAKPIDPPTLYQTLQEFIK